MMTAPRWHDPYTWFYVRKGAYLTAAESFTVPGPDLSLARTSCQYFIPLIVFILAAEPK